MSGRILNSKKIILDASTFRSDDLHGQLENDDVPGNACDARS